ncbi:MAG: apolipoprotein N-acyltransferase [Chlorobi bacterium]|nr:apolipoprotein N-acyltransferase [Chlorobiota bacterium]
MKRSLRILLSVVSGIILSLAWLEFPGWILFVAFLPLLLLDDFFVREKHRFKSVSFWGHTYLAFIIWNGLATWWVMYATILGAIVVIFLNSLLMSLVWWLAHVARRRLPGNLGYISLIVFWISFEFFHYHWQIEWPWLTLGNGFANNVKMVQWYEVTGVFGGSLWILTVNILLFLLLMRLHETGSLKASIRPALIILLIIFIPVFGSIIRYNSYVEKKDEREIVIVQPNIDPYSETYDKEASNRKLDKFIDLSMSGIDNNTDFIVGPETVFEQQWDEDRLNRYPQFRRLSAITRMAPQSDLIIGASTYKIYKEGGDIPSTARESGDGRYLYDMFNTAILTNYSGANQIYHKSILVSGVEKMPFRKYLGFMERFIIKLGGATGSLGSQDEPTNFIASDSTIVAPVICYESVFGEYLAKFVKKGAQLIFIITNDGWWKNTPGYKQHLSFARLRAIETRRSIARSANTGISCFINQRGDILQQTGWWVEAVIKGELNINDKLTFYVKHGDYLARVAVFISVLIVLYMVSVSLRRIS